MISAIYEIAEGMRYGHFITIIHRDLNPKNILITENGTMKIGEFGSLILMTLEEQISLSMEGDYSTIKFIAPELIDMEKYDEKVDVYSFEMLILFILNKGKIAFDSDNNKIKIPSSFTDYCKKIINQCTLKQFAMNLKKIAQN